jgi:hypothetical protein
MGEGALALSVNYPTPVWVNGFECRNCTDVDFAKKHIDPAHPQSGPFNVDAKSDPSRLLQDTVSFGGQSFSMGGSSASSSQPGAQLDLSV